MASTDMSPRESGSAPDTGIDQRGDASAPGVDAAPADADTTMEAGASGEEERPARRFRGSGASPAERARMLKGLRSIEFPGALRGYDRGAVDRYVEQVNRSIAELEISASPEAAVRHALDEVSEETRDLLQRAHQTAGEIVARAGVRADEQTADAQAHAQEMRESAQSAAASVRDGAQREARELLDATHREAQEVRDTAAREAAETRETVAREIAATRETANRESQRLHAAAQREADEVREKARRAVEQMLETAEGRERELVRSAETIWRERRRLIEDVRTVGDQLVGIGEAEAKRFAQFPFDGAGSGPADGGVAPEPPKVGASADDSG